MSSSNNNIAQVNADFSTVLTPASIKAGMKAAGAGSRDLWQIDPTKLRVIEGFNPRVTNDAYTAHIRSIADSIKSEGFYQDQAMAGYVASVDGEAVVYIYSGHTRLLATLLAISEGTEIPCVPVSVSQAGLSMEDMTVALIRGNGGQNLTYFESAVVCKRLIKYGFTEEQISTRTGITVPLVRNRLALMSAPLKLREMVANDLMSATLALELITTHGDKALEAAELALGRAEENGKTKVRKTQVAHSPRASFVKKNATRSFAAAESVFKDPGFANLSAATKELLHSLISDIENLPTEPEVDVNQTALDLNDNKEQP